jgi:hypothetical protein
MISQVAEAPAAAGKASKRLSVVSMAAFSSLSALCSLSLLVTSNPPAALRRPRCVGREGG